MAGGYDMKCQEAQKHLSPLLDNMLESGVSIRVSTHLDECSACRLELRRLRLVRARLGSLEKVSSPEFLKHLIQMQLESTPQERLGVRLRRNLEYKWSRVRTTEGLWYLTRMVGTAMTAVFFFVLYTAMSPVYFSLRPPLPQRPAVSQDRPQQLAVNVLNHLGLTPPSVAFRKPVSSSEAMISDLYFLKFGQSASGRGADDTVTLFTTVDRRGSAKIQNVLEYPSDSTLLDNFSEMIASARCRPAIHNGKAIDSPLVLTFSKISVYD
jgi:Putative zinc-finger